jgi:hypothetical protein
MNSTKIISKAILWMPILLLSLVMYVVLFVCNRILMTISSSVMWVLKQYLTELKTDAKGTYLEEYFDKFDIED